MPLNHIADAFLLVHKRIFVMRGWRVDSRESSNEIIRKVLGYTSTCGYIQVFHALNHKLIT